MRRVAARLELGAQVNCMIWHDLEPLIWTYIRDCIWRIYHCMAAPLNGVLYP